MGAGAEPITPVWGSGPTVLLCHGFGHARNAARIRQPQRCALPRRASPPHWPFHLGQAYRVRSRLAAGGRWIRTSGTADDARLLADLYTHNASRQMPQKGSSDQAVACLRRLGAGVVGSAAVCAFRFRPPGTGSKRAGWRRSGAIFAFFAAVCFEPDASRARLRFKAVMRSMTGGGAAISLGLTVSPFILASISSCKASW